MQWEYTKGKDLSTEQLNGFGIEGWELVSVLYTYATYWYYFKRKIS